MPMGETIFWRKKMNNKELNIDKNKIVDTVFENLTDCIVLIEQNRIQANAKPCNCAFDEICNRFSQMELKTIQKFLVAVFSLHSIESEIRPTRIDSIESFIYKALIKHVTENLAKNNEVWSEEIEG